MVTATRRVFVVLTILAGLAILWFHWGSGTSFVTAPDITWTNPSATTLNNLGPTGEAPARSYDCTPLSYRMIDDLSKTMHDGCFVTAAFGMLDPDRGVAIFNGTDEAEEIRYGGSTAALNVLPYSASVARFGGFPGQGAYMYLYTYFPSNITDSRDVFLHRYKDLAGTPNFTLPGPDGQPLAINPQAFAYSGRGQWLVTETPSHSLVRINLATFSVLPFGPTFSVPAQPYASHSASMAVTQDGRYAAAASTEFATFKVYDLKSCGVTSASDALAPQHCQSHDYWDYVRTQVTGTLKSITQVRFVSDNIISFTATTNLGAETYELSPDGSLHSLIPYLGLGDSFASGQGAWNYLPGTDTAVNHCHLSAHSYPLRLQADLFGGTGHSVACSGATTHDVGSVAANYTGQASDQRSAQEREADGSEVHLLHDFSPGYLAQQRFVESYQPGVITLQIGGNDIGFGAMLLSCMSPLTRAKTLSPNSCYSDYEDRLEVEQSINRAYPQLVALYKQLQRTAPQSHLYIIGYPHIIARNARCGLNVHVTAGDIEFARDATNYLNGVIQKAARAAGVTFVDVSNALAGHELCERSLPAVNGITAGNDALGMLGQESFHPNALGHELLEQAILTATKNFKNITTPVSLPSEPPPTTAATDPLLQAPRSGRTVRTVNRAVITSARRALKGSTVRVSASGAKHGLKPSSSFSVRLGSTTIGTVVSDAQGNIEATVTIPLDVGTGTQPITITGPGQNNDPITVVDDTYIDHSTSDVDGDGIANDDDTCPLIIDSGSDADTDELDDACDYDLAPPPTAGGTPTPAAPIPEQTISNQTVSLGGKYASPLRVVTLKKIQISNSAHRAKGSVLGVKQAGRPRVAVVGAGPAWNHGNLPVFWWYIWILVVALMLGIITLCQVLVRRFA